MTGSRACHGSRIGGLLFEFFSGHDVPPMDEVTILDGQCDWRSESFPVSDTGKYFNDVFLDLHPAAAAVALLPAPQFVVDCGDVDRQTRGQSFDDGDERFTVRFTCGCKFELHISESDEG